MSKYSRVDTNVCTASKVTADEIKIQGNAQNASNVGNVNLLIEGIQNNDLNNSSPDIIFQRDPANGNCVNGNYCAEIHFKGRNDAASMVSFGAVNCYVQDPAAGAQKGSVITQVACGDGNTAQALKIRGGTKGSSPNVLIANGPLVHWTPQSFTADDTTPSVAGANIFNTVENTGATAITALDDGLPGQMVVVRCGHATNAPTIADSGNFIIAGAWEPNAVGETITLMNFSGNYWTEISRSDNA